MNTLAFLNGQFVPLNEAKISPMDRGFLFGDSLYEVIPVYNGKPFSLNAHLDRLTQGLEEIHMSSPYSYSEWKTILQTLVDKNGGQDQCIYVQFSRGPEPIRDQRITPTTQPTIFAYSYFFPRPTKEMFSEGIKVVGLTDIRWKYSHIKTCSRMAYILMYQEARANGGEEGIIINNGFVTEGTASNIFIVRHGVLITPPKSSLLLGGITRALILSLAEKHHIPYRETKISERDCLKADEIWITSSTRLIRPVTQFNDTLINNGQSGPMWEKIWELYAEETNKLSLPISH